MSNAFFYFKHNLPDRDTLCQNVVPKESIHSDSAKYPHSAQYVYSAGVYLNCIVVLYIQ